MCSQFSVTATRNDVVISTSDTDPESALRALTSKLVQYHNFGQHKVLDKDTWHFRLLNDPWVAIEALTDDQWLIQFSAA